VLKDKRSCFSQSEKFTVAVSWSCTCPLEVGHLIGIWKPQANVCINLPRFDCDLMPCLLQQDSWDTIWCNMAGSKWAARFQAKLSQVDRKEYGSSRTKPGHRWMGCFGGKFGLVGWSTMHTQEKLYLKAFCYSNILVLFPGQVIKNGRPGNEAKWFHSPALSEKDLILA